MISLLYIRNKMIHFSYKGGYGVRGHHMHIDVLKRRVSFDHR